MGTLIYLDVCCLNRPFDDQTQKRIFLEAEAVRIILAHCQSGEWQLLGSEVVDDELAQTPDGERKQQIMDWIVIANTKILATAQVKFRARELANLGFKAFDASHIACAEAGNANIFLTTDDRMLRLAVRNKNLLQVRVENPLQWLMEVTNAGRN